jgi:alkylhydroperoxidase/carboxymuconolactone decarboxylase family protein YurZ
MNTTKEQNMINMTVCNLTHNAYVRIDNITCPMGKIDEKTRKINAIKAIRNIAFMDADSRRVSSSPSNVSNLVFLAGLKEAKNFVQSFLNRLNEAHDNDTAMILTSDTLQQDELEMIVAVIMFNTPCRYEVYYRDREPNP